MARSDASIAAGGRVIAATAASFVIGQEPLLLALPITDEVTLGPKDRLTVLLHALRASGHPGAYDVYLGSSDPLRSAGRISYYGRLTPDGVGPIDLALDVTALFAPGRIAGRQVLRLVQVYAWGAHATVEEASLHLRARAGVD